MGGGDEKSANASGRARMIIDPIDGTEEFSRGIPTFGTLMGIESNGEIVAAMVSAPGLHSRWWAYRGGGSYRDGKRRRLSKGTRQRKAKGVANGTGPAQKPPDQESLRETGEGRGAGRAGGSGLAAGNEKRSGED